MKKVLAALLLLVCANAIGQDIVLTDSIRGKAMSQNGYVDTKLTFGDFSGTTTDGKIFTQESLKNKITFINFWFEHCAPCIAEIDALNNLYNKYKNNPGFQFISISFEKNEDIKRIAKKYHIEYPVISLERDKIDPLIFNLGFPTNIIVDQAGKISYMKSGSSLEKERIQQEFDKVLSKHIERVLFPQ
jgi:cytochrome oxidase Cu insertion factor (SCO1/SenC/PrrC family)